ncbi:MAG: hypothetical protein HYZ42_07550 [Bacteroidetes bacterium]|nr:hypothetical protein [Bacteroidota bacterium]
MIFNNSNKLVNYTLETAFKTYTQWGHKQKNFITYIANLIGVMPDTIRKKNSGTKSYTSDELNAIIEHFNLEFNSANQNINDLEFKPIASSESNFLNYFKTIALQLRYIQSCNTKKIRLTSEDLPIFYYFEYEHLTAFKLYFYKHTLFSSKDLLDNHFLDKNDFEQLNYIASIYNQIPSEELWTPRTIDSTISQLIYLYDTKKITDIDIISKILNEFNELIEVVFLNAENESKNGKDKNFIMYRSDITISNNHICFETENMKAGFVNMTTFNSIKIHKPEYIDEIEKWLECMFKSGVKISGEGVAYRNSLIDIYKSKLNLLHAYIIKKDQNAKMKLMGI